MERIDKFEKFKKEYSQIKSKIVGSELFEMIKRTPSQNLLEWKKSRIMEKIDV
jgi:hypothetical protein